MERTYDSRLEACDWRDSAAIVGLTKFLKFHDIEYSQDRDFIHYNQEDITEERFQQFVEYVCEEDIYWNLTRMECKLKCYCVFAIWTKIGI